MAASPTPSGRTGPPASSRRAGSPTSSRRRYDSPKRRQHVLETRERIVAAGCHLLRESSVRDWRVLTIRAVAEHAGVNERTVYRYFGNEQGLRDAVMHRLEQESGIELDGMRLEDVADVTARIFSHVSSYPRQARPSLDPTLADAQRRQRASLFEALDERTARWSDPDRATVASLLDVLWSVATYERLVSDWEMDTEQAIATVTWAIELVQDALSSGRRPSGGPPKP